MATPRRQPRPATDNEAFRAKLATMTYSFAQQLPQLSSHTPPPPPHNPQNTPTDDSNFPKLTSKPVYSQTNRTGQSVSRAWDSAKRPPTPGRPPRWANGPGKPTTAAEVVASVPSDTSAQSEEAAESEKQEAELALYSKLVPTTSAVPRNPGSLLGGGGLRATGSVAAQKSLRPNAGTALHSPQPLTSLPRKEPMVSRMRSLSSEASKPQLARRVAKPNRSASATPPPVPSVPSSASSNASADGMESETTIDDELEKAGMVTLPSSMRKDEVSHLRNGSEEGYPLSSTKGTLFLAASRRQNDSRESKVTSAPPRRLDEAFLNRSRTETGSSGTGMANGRKPALSASRRSSAPSPPPGHRRDSGKDGHGKGGGWAGKETFDTCVPPGFEGRSTVNRGSFPRSRSGKSETEPANPSRPLDRGNPPVRPQNARADALREALNSRGRTNSPRVLRNFRHNHSDSISDANGSEPVSSEYNAMRKRSERGLTRPANAADDFTRRSNSASSRQFDAELSTPDVSRPRRFSAGNPMQHSKLSESRGTRSSMGSRTQGRAKLHSVELRKEPRSSARDYPRSTPRSVETKGSARSTMKASLLLGTGNTVDYDGHMHDESEEKILSNVSELSEQYEGAYPSGNTGPPYTQEPGSWRSTVNEMSIGGSDRQPFVNNLFDSASECTARFSQNSSFANSERNPSSSGLSMIDDVTGFNGNAGEPGARNGIDGMDDVVLPPLPNSEDVAFESMLRSMGWTPLDEDDGPNNYQNQNIRTSQLSGNNDGPLRDGDPIQDGADTMENRSIGRGYYSHFQ